MKWFFCVYAVLLYGVSWGQVTYTIKPGIDVLEIIPSNEVYRYPGFIQGTVVFKDGASSTGRLNYNSLIGEMQFIGPKGDTFSLAEEQTIRHVLVSSDTFYYSEGYIRLIKEGRSVKLGEKVVFREFVQKPGAYGLSSSTTATNNLAFILNKRSVDLNISQEIVLVKSISWFIGNKFNDFQPADKKTVLKMFARKKQAVEEYLKNNDMNFNKRDDLIRLTDFLNGL
jgi:hypothetical protein